MALEMRRPMPLAAQEAEVIVESDCRPSISELDVMPQELVDTIILYKNMKAVIETGAQIDL